MNTEKFYKKIKNSPKNVDFNKMKRFLESLDFIDTAKGTGHHIYKKRGVKGRVNIQNNNGVVYSYQVKQIIKVIEENNII